MVTLLLLCALARAASPDVPLSWPLDHGAHAEAQTEWWYAQGIVRGPNGHRLAVFLSSVRHNPRHDRFLGIPFGFLARTGLLSFACVADLDTGERLSQRWSLSSVPEPYHRAEGAEDWFSTRAFGWRAWGGGGRLTFQVPTALGQLTLAATPTDPPLPIGAIPYVAGAAATGHDAIPGAAFDYYTMPRAKLTGELRRGRHTEPLAGEGWIEHQYGLIFTQRYLGWWWLAVMLDDGTDLLLAQVQPRRAGGEGAQLGTVRTPDGASRLVGPFAMVPKAQWTSPRTKTSYPNGLTVTDEGDQIQLDVSPLRVESEWRVQPVPIWEGPVAVTGTRAGNPVKGTGFAEFLVHGNVWARDQYESGEAVVGR